MAARRGWSQKTIAALSLRRARVSSRSQSPRSRRHIPPLSAPALRRDKSRRSLARHVSRNAPQSPGRRVLFEAVSLARVRLSLALSFPRNRRTPPPPRVRELSLAHAARLV